jgi:acyl-CoA thioesterase
MSDSFFLSVVPLLHGILPFPQMAQRYSQVLESARGLSNTNAAPDIGMMTSLSHTIQFHSPDFAADEWMYTEMGCPWAGEDGG